MSRAEYSGRPGNFSGTFFQKGKTGHQSLNFVHFLYCRFEHQYLTDRNHHHWWKALERTKGLFDRPPRASHRSCLYHIDTCIVDFDGLDFGWIVWSCCLQGPDVVDLRTWSWTRWKIIIITILIKVIVFLHWIRLLKVLSIQRWTIWRGSLPRKKERRWPSATRSM